MNARSFVRAATAGILLIPLATPVEAQESRADLVEAARNEFDVGTKMELLTRAADPGLAPLDSLWAVAVYDLAAALMEQNQGELASLWLRWGARHGMWPIDRSWYAPAVVRAYDEAVPAGIPGEPADDPRTSTSWRWPDELDAGASGVVEAGSADPAVPVSVDVRDGGTIAPDGALSLDPGTYELVAYAEGYDTTRVTREVLPGATTVLRFDLAPLLPDDVVAGVSNSLVRIRYLRGGQQVCTSGLIARPSGLVLTSYDPLRGVTGLEVVRSGNVYGGVAIAASDPDRNLAVLRFGARDLPVLPTATDVGADQYVWSVHHPGCAGATSARSQLAAWDPSGGAAPLAEPLPSDALGAPVVDRDGSLLGVVVGPDEVAPLTLAGDLLDEAVADLVASETGEQVSAAGGGGGFPVMWVGAGAAAVGVAALLLGGGGGDGDGGGGGDGTGGIVVTFPGGGP